MSRLSGKRQNSSTPEPNSTKYRFVTEKQTESVSNTYISQLIQSVQWWRQQIRVELYPRFDAERYSRYNQDQLVTGEDQVPQNLSDSAFIKCDQIYFRLQESPFRVSTLFQLAPVLLLLPPVHVPSWFSARVMFPCAVSFILSRRPPSAWGSSSNTSFTYFLHLQKSLVATSREQTFPPETEENNASRYASFECYPHIRSEIRYNAVVLLCFHCLNEMSLLSLETVLPFN